MTNVTSPLFHELKELAITIVTPERVADFDYKPLLRAVQGNQWRLPIGAVLVYLLAIFVIIPRIRPSTCPKLISRHGFAAWNIFLAIFSWFGVFAGYPHIYQKLTTNGFQYMICSDKMMLGDAEDQPTSMGFMGVMISLFALSKIPELMDTFFLAYMGKPLLFLHWYHHITALLYAWFSFVSVIPSSVFFATINYSVHSVMYFYFGASIYTKKLSFLRKPITSVQLIQMFFCFGLTAVTYLYTIGVLGDGNCSKVYEESHFFYSCLALYGVYIFLFAKLYVDNYVKKRNNKKMKKTE